MLIGLMVATLIMAVALPEAFGERGLLFAVAFVAMQVGRTAFAIVGTRDYPGCTATFSVFWRGGRRPGCSGSPVVSQGQARTTFWVAAVAMDSLGPAPGFVTPGLGRSTTRDWHISAAHMAERCKLFLIIALGESILVTGARLESRFHPGGAGGVRRRVPRQRRALVGLFRSQLRCRGACLRVFERPGRLGRFAYTYLHIPMVAGIIVTAVGDELVIAHPFGHAGPDTVATVLGGPALFLAGHLLFKRACSGSGRSLAWQRSWRWAPSSRSGARLAALALAIAIVLIIAAVSWQELRTHPTSGSRRRAG